MDFQSTVMIPRALSDIWHRVTQSVAGRQPQEDVTAHFSADDHSEERQPFIADLDISDHEPRQAWITRKLLRTWNETRNFIGSEQGVGIFKCSLAYFLASLAVFVPFIGSLLGHQNGKHMVATITVYFHPARSQGSMYKALMCAFVAFIYAAALSLSSMWVTIIFHQRYDMIELGHAVVLIVFVAGGFGCIGWFKQKMEDPLVNVACSLASLASIIVITREGAVQKGALSFEKIGQVLRMILLGVGVTTAVSLLILPRSARRRFRGNLSALTRTAMSMLTIITESAVSGSPHELQQVQFANLSMRHDNALSELKHHLQEAKLEHFVVGTEREYLVAKRLSNLIQEITRRLGALRSAVTLESKTFAPGGTSHLNHSGAQAFEIFNSQLETSMVRAGPGVCLTWYISNARKNLLVSTLRTIFQTVSFGSAPDHKIVVDGRARLRINEAIKTYQDSRLVALRSISRKEIIIPLSEEDGAHFEKIVATRNYYSVSLLEITENIEQFMLALEQMQVETEQGPRNRSWMGIWTAWRWGDNTREGNHSNEDMSSESFSNYLHADSNTTGLAGMRFDNNYTESQSPGVNLHSRSKTLRWRCLNLLRADELKFALKVGIGAALYTLPAFISWTRPLYLFWRGEWGLLSYMLVCSMTIGASNTTGFARFIGTCVGALCSIAAWYLVGESAPGLAFLGFLVALGPFYMIISRGQGPMGRFILLTYNLSVLYAYSYSQTDSDHPDRSGEHLNITEIVLHRVISVTAGCIWGIIITRGIWPIRAWARLNDTLHQLWLRLLVVWMSDPLSNRATTEANTSDSLLQPQDKLEIERLLSQLERLRVSARSEFELKNPFPDVAYSNIIRRTRSITDNFYSLDLILVNALGQSEAHHALLIHCGAARHRLSTYICQLLAGIASSIQQERACAGILTNIDTIHNELLAQTYQFRRDRVLSSQTDDVDYALVHSFTLVTQQLSNDILEIKMELDRIYPRP
ncbi:unnamed protein product [Penicillium olsonii]|uniref:Integral membrane bound transporter domain-containing protein n=1 Tax=Penicillium olsonii TaxID=99116 RepID=A0A9W4HYV7_PENOL|nr:unnamed protein product [Penicillium olsonii]CAG8206359.1 unnamed protein product [Penicillium olsonii]